MKLEPREPIDGINTPPSHMARDITALLMGAVVIVGAFFLIIGAVVDFAVDHLDPETEREVFASVLPSVLDSMGENGWDTEAEEALTPLFARVREAAPSLPYDFVLRVSCEPIPNALALPGGAIVVTSGLLEIMETEEELAFVLGHELGHFAQRDHLRGMGRAAALQLIMGTMLMTTGIDPTVAIQIALDAFSSAHSREQETTADTVGLDVLAAMNNGDVSGAQRALNALHAALGEGSLDHVDFLRSHPVGSVRREALKARIEDKAMTASKTRGTPLAPALRAACQGEGDGP